MTPSGNMTVRSVAEADGSPKPDGGIIAQKYKVPSNAPLHVHIFSLHNTAREWTDPKVFDPTRWQKELDAELGDTEAEADDRGKRKQPMCPYMQRIKSSLEERKNNGTEDLTQYCGDGHSEDSLSFLPFSAGERQCPGKLLALQTLREVMYQVCSNFRLDPVDPLPQDIGSSMNAVIVPDEISVSVSVSRDGLCEMPVKKKKDPNEGWADEDDDDDVPPLTSTGSLSYIIDVYSQNLPNLLSIIFFTGTTVNVNVCTCL